MSEEIKGDITEIGPLGDEAKVNKRRKAVDLAKEQEQADIIAVMSTPHGRSFVAWLLREGEAGSVSFYETDRITAFMLGQQNMANKVIAKAREHCLQLLRLMEDEDLQCQKQRK
jgi:hypothetical protein